MGVIDFEAEYNNRRRVANSADIAARWIAASGQVRHRLSPYYEYRYGDRPRNMVDVFRTSKRGHTVPLAVYIHGGYWQRGDRKDYSFVVERLLERGVDVAVPSYSLCPEVAVMDIVGELRLCLAWLWRHTSARPVVVGHSAGGHLAAAMLATDWSAVPGVPDDLVASAYAISGTFELAPLLSTSLNEALRLDNAAAAAASPILWRPPAAGRRLVAAVGGDESGEFIRQSLAIVAAWSAAGVAAECVVVPMTNHFTVVDELTRGDSAMVRRIAELARG